MALQNQTTKICDLRYLSVALQLCFLRSAGAGAAESLQPTPKRRLLSRWAPSSCQTLYLAQSLQCCILPKMTASLPLTDTDFSRRFKVFGRSAMGDLRQSCQEALLKSGSREVWIASHEDAGQLRPVIGPVSEYPIGSARLNSAWLKERYDWVKKLVNGTLAPLPPDYSVIGGSKALTDLHELAFWQESCEPEEDAGNEDAL